MPGPPSLPSPKAKGIFDRAWFVEGLGTIPPIVGVALTAFAEKAITLCPGDKPATRPWWLNLAWGSVALWMLAAAICRVLKSKRDEGRVAPEDPYRHLVGPMQTVYHILAGAKGVRAGLDSDKDRLRVSLLRVDDKEIVQVTDYAGGSRDGKGRRFTLQGGIIGHAALTGRPCFASREPGSTYESYLNELVERWHMTPAQAKEVKPDRLAWGAIPITGKEDKAIAIIYLDSTEADFFTDDVQAQALCGATGVAKYLAGYYSEKHG